MSKEAITFIEIGKGLGRTRYPVIRLGRINSALTWHVLDPNSPICNTRGAVSKIADEVDARAIIYDKTPVCVKCRSLLPPIPETTYVRSL